MSITNTKWSQDRLLEEMRSGSLLNAVRVKMSSHHGRIDQAEMQRSKSTIWDIRRMEYEAAEEILQLISERMDAFEAWRESA